MKKTTLDNAWDEEEFDFGFTSVSESELKEKETVLARTVVEQRERINTLESTYEEKLNKMYKMITPLLKNLSKDDGKEYIYWPDRKTKVEEFIKKLDNLMK